MAIIQGANLILAFVLELCALAALGYWGYQTGQSLPLKLLLAVGAPLLAAVVWGLFVAPKAAIAVGEPVRFLLAMVVFAAAAAGLAATGHVTLAIAFLIIAIVNRILLLVWGQ